MTTWPESGEGDHEITVLSGVAGERLTIWSWIESHSADSPTPGPHVAINGVPQTGGTRTSLVVHLDQVPALVAALTAAAAHLAGVWERDGEQYWTVEQPSPAP